MCIRTNTRNTVKRYYRLVRSSLTKKALNQLETLEEICRSGFTNLLRWFLGRGKWSVLVQGVQTLLCSGLNIFFF